MFIINKDTLPKIPWLLIGALFIAMLIAIRPLVILFYQSLNLLADQGTGFLVTVFGDPKLLRAAFNSVAIGTGAALLSLLIGGFFALVFSLFSVYGQTFLTIAFMLPLIVSPQITTLCWVSLVSPASPILTLLGWSPPLGVSSKIYSPLGIVWVLGLQNASLVFLFIMGGLKRLSGELVEAARLCDGRLYILLFKIILPPLKSYLWIATTLSFISAIGNFGVPALLGIPVKYTVLSTLIYQKFAGMGLNAIGELSLISLVLGGIAILSITLQHYAAHKGDKAQHITYPIPRLHLGRWHKWFTAVLWLGISGIFILPLINLFLSSLLPAYGFTFQWQEASLDSYRFILHHPGAYRGLRNSIFFATACAAILCLWTVIMGYGFWERRHRWASWMMGLFEIPYAVPGIVLSFCHVLVYLPPLPFINKSIYNTLWILLFAYLARFLPLCLRFMMNGYHQIDRSLQEIAIICGAGFFRRLRSIMVPLLTPNIISSFVLIFLLCFNDLAVSSLLWSSGLETVGVMIFELEQAGESSVSAAFSTLATLVTIGIMMTSTFLSRFIKRMSLPWQT